MSGAMACEACLARSWLLARLGGHLEPVRARAFPLLALSEAELIDAVAGDQARAVRRELASFDAGGARERLLAARQQAVCRHHQRYPPSLRALEAPPAVIHLAGGGIGDLGETPKARVAIVGSRRPSRYGLEMAGSLARGLARAGMLVVSGMALGIDAAAHQGALEGSGSTVAVLPGGADRTYPPSKRRLYTRIREAGAVISELPPGTTPWRWTFPARNRIVAALAGMTVVVEARPGSGALITARLAAGLERTVGAVPGQVTSAASAGPNALLAAGATVVRDPQDILDALFGAGVRRAVPEPRAPLGPDQAALLRAISEGHDTAAAMQRCGLAPEAGLAALAALELGGHVRREPGGRYAVRAGAGNLS